MNKEEFKYKAHVSQTIKNLFYEYNIENDDYKLVQEALDEITDMLSQELAEFIVTEKRHDVSQLFTLRSLIEMYAEILSSIYDDDAEFLK